MRSDCCDDEISEQRRAQRLADRSGAGPEIPRGDQSPGTVRFRAVRPDPVPAAERFRSTHPSSSKL